MALLDVSGLSSYSKFGTPFLSKQTQLVDRPSHYNFGSKCQEFAIPVGVDVSNEFNELFVTVFK